MTSCISAVLPFVLGKAGRGIAYGLRADETHERPAAVAFDELPKEVAVDGDMAHDKILRFVEIDLAGPIKAECLAPAGVLEHFLGLRVPVRIGCPGLRNDAGAADIARHAIHGAGGKADVVVEPARLAEDVGARAVGELLPRL